MTVPANLCGDLNRSPLNKRIEEDDLSLLCRLCSGLDLKSEPREAAS